MLDGRDAARWDTTGGGAVCGTVPGSVSVGAVVDRVVSGAVWSDR